MKIFENEHFYRNKDFIFLYPTKEEAEKALYFVHGYFNTDPGGFDLKGDSEKASFEMQKRTVLFEIDHLKKVFGLDLSLIEPEEMFFVISSTTVLDQKLALEREIVQVIFGEKVGYILHKGWMGFESVTV